MMSGTVVPTACGTFTVPLATTKLIGADWLDRPVAGRVDVGVAQARGLDLDGGCVTGAVDAAPPNQQGG
jgi:hypothetical protein